MTIQEIVGGGGGLLLVLMTLVQIAPVKLNPWSAVARVIGRAINSDVSKRLDDIEKKLDGHITMDDRRMAESHRQRILHFNNELLRDIDHTHEEFREVLSEIDPNNRAVLAIENIREVYKERLKKHDFLQESSAAKKEVHET